MLSPSITFTAGQTVKFSDVGNFVRVLSANAGVTLRAFKNGQVISESKGVTTGYAEEFDENFEAVEVYSATAQTVQLVIRLGVKVYFDAPPSGNVSVTNLTPAQATAINTNPAVTNVSSLIVGANPAREYLLIQNKDDVGNIYIVFGTGATIANGVKIEAGGSFELNCNIITSAIFAIGDIASNSNIVVVQG